MSVSLIIILAVCAALLFTVWFFYAKIRGFIRRTFGPSETLRSLIQKGEAEAETTVKSLPAATDLVLPRIRADFPQFHWPEFKADTEKRVLHWLTAQGYEEPLIHRTALAEYRKEKGNCYAVLWSAVQYMKEGKKVQSRCRCVMGYVQDPDKAGYENGIGLKCPSCGAPVTNLGEKKCRYCGTPIEEINIRIWREVSITEA